MPASGSDRSEWAFEVCHAGVAHGKRQNNIEHVLICMCIYIYTDIYIYIHIYICMNTTCSPAQISIEAWRLRSGVSGSWLGCRAELQPWPRISKHLNCGRPSDQRVWSFTISVRTVQLQSSWKQSEAATSSTKWGHGGVQHRRQANACVGQRRPGPHWTNVSGLRRGISCQTLPA